MSWLEEHIAEHGPYLWHATTPTRLPLIAKQGLRPAASALYGERERFSPRTGHVYLGRLDVVRRHYGEPQLRIDLREVSASSLVCDEDIIDPYCNCIALSSLFRAPEVAELLQQVPPVPPQKWEATVHQSVGEWANAHPLLNGAFLAALSLREAGVIAHRGALPPAAVQMLAAPHPDPQVGAWQPGRPGMLMLCAMHGVDDLWHPTGAYTLDLACDEVAYEFACHRTNMLNPVLCAGAIAPNGEVWVDGIFAADTIPEKVELLCQQTDSRLRYMGLHPDVFVIHDPSYHSRQSQIFGVAA